METIGILIKCSMITDNFMHRCWSAIMTSCKNALSKDVVYSVVDWALVVISFVVGYALENVSPFERKIVPNESIDYPYTARETVPTYLLFILSVITPSLIIIATCFTRRTKWTLIHIALLGLFISASYTYLSTNILKIAVGRLRPDFMNRCNPSKPYNTNSSITCNPNSQHIITYGRKSFPSGHSSLAFAGLTYLSLFAFFQTKRLNSGALRIFLVTLPFMGAALVGISRLNDYRHHWEDVVAGAIIGIIFAYSSYIQYNNPRYKTIDEEEDELALISSYGQSQDVQEGKPTDITEIREDDMV